MSTNSGEAEQIIEILVYISAQMQILSSSSSTKKGCTVAMPIFNSCVEIVLLSIPRKLSSRRSFLVYIFLREKGQEYKSRRCYLFCGGGWSPYLLQMRPQE